MPVRILDELLINKIAAGEVVERPASVVKELVENALDAGARSLRVHLRAGGRNLVRVVDDGAGMNRTDALMCTERHATSKIRTEDDLFRVGTLGFRGEAIPSIAAVSKFEILTRPHDAEVGTRVVIEGGKLLEVEPAGCAPGTQISAGSLFFNLPARRKFLRSVETELGHCLEAITREALVRPELDLEVTHDDREVVRAPAVPTRARRAADLLGPHGEALVPVSFRRGALEVEALLSPVGVHRSTPGGSTWLYVNGRFVKDLVLRRAVTQAYAGIVPKDRYPMVVLEVRLPPGEVDVNVHPAKTEVRFVHGFELQAAVAEGLRAALQEHGIRRPVAVEARYRAPEAPATVQLRLGGEAAEAPAVPGWARPEPEAAGAQARGGEGERPVGTPGASSAASGASSGAPSASGTAATPVAPASTSVAPATPPAPAVPSAPPPSAAPPPPGSAASAGAPSAGWSPPARPASPLPPPAASSPPPAASSPPPAPSRPAPTPPAAPAPAPLLVADAPLLPVPRFRDLRVIGQLGGTYVLCEGRGELVIVDQHAAHERVTLYRLMRDPRATLGGGQRLLTPVLVDLPPARARALAPHVDALAEWGIELTPVGGATFAVQAVPATLRHADLPGLLADVADEVAEGAPVQAATARFEHFLATLACHTSVRAGQQLSHREMEELLKALDEVDFSVCAHGRPVVIRIAPSELERRFHRA